MTTSDPRSEATGKRAIDAAWEPIDADIPVVKGTVAAKDPGKGHFYISMVKSAIRFFAYGIMLGVGGGVAWAGLALIAAEVLGIAEELV